MPVQLPPDAPSPRVCLVRKAAPADEYGFNLHAERTRGQYVGAVDAGSAAHLGGLRERDRIVGVNGQVVVGLSHKEVVYKIKADPLQCELLVVSEPGFEWFQSHNIPISYGLPNIVRPVQVLSMTPSSSSSCTSSIRSTDLLDPVFVSEARLEMRTRPKAASTEPPQPRPRSASMSPRPLLCTLRKTRPTEEFGFNLHAERNKGHFIGSVDKGGIADLAGLETGQRIVGVNGELIYPTSPHKEVVALIKRDPLDTILLVASEEVDKWYTENGIPYSFDLVLTQTCALRSQARTATNISHRTNDTTQSTEDAPADAVYVPEELAERPSSLAEEVRVAASEEAQALQELEDAVSGSPDELLGQVFSAVPPPPTESQQTKVRDVAPQISTPTPQIRASHLAENRLNGLSVKDENVDIFKLSAKEARQAMKHRKRDPRSQAQMTLEEKHQLIANL